MNHRTIPVVNVRLHLRDDIVRVRPDRQIIRHDRFINNLRLFPALVHLVILMNLRREARDHAIVDARLDELVLGRVDLLLVHDVLRLRNYGRFVLRIDRRFDGLVDVGRGVRLRLDDVTVNRYRNGVGVVVDFLVELLGLFDVLSTLNFSILRLLHVVYVPG